MKYKKEGGKEEEKKKRNIYGKEGKENNKKLISSDAFELYRVGGTRDVSRRWDLYGGELNAGLQM